MDILCTYDLKKYYENGQVTTKAVEIDGTNIFELNDEVAQIFARRRTFHICLVFKYYGLENRKRMETKKSYL